MVGNFKILIIISLFETLFSCSIKNTNKDAGKEILYQNFNAFLTDLPIFPSKENSDGILPVIVLDSITKNELIIQECGEDCFNKINLEGFKINRNSKYILFKIDNLPKSIAIKKIKLKKNNEKIKISEYVELSFSNLYIDNDISKAFIIVTKDEIGSKGGITEVYFFKKINDKWIFYKKELLLLA